MSVQLHENRTHQLGLQNVGLFTFFLYKNLKVQFVRMLV